MFSRERKGRNGGLMARLMALLTLVSTCFALVAIVLINVGGVHDVEHKAWQSFRETNTALNLISWRFTIAPTPSLAQQTYRYTVYLHRFCTGIASAPKQCHSITADDGILTSSGYAPSTFITQLNLLQFDDVNLKAPFAFYVLGAVMVTGLLIWGIVGAFNKKGRWLRILGVLCSTIAFLSLLIASSILTWQLFRLRDQIENETPGTLAPMDESGDFRIVTRVRDLEVEIGKVVLGLSWATTVVVVMQIPMWMFELRNFDRIKEADRQEKGTGNV